MSFQPFRAVRRLLKFRCFLSALWLHKVVVCGSGAGGWHGALQNLLAVGQLSWPSNQRQEKQYMASFRHGLSSIRQQGAYVHIIFGWALS
jgi:hypothetical protein